MTPREVAAGTARAGIPRNGDVVIGRDEKRGKAPYGLCAVPAPDQLCCRTRLEAERLALGYAERAGVDVWMAESPGRLVMLASYREATGPERPAVSAPAERGGSGRWTSRRQ